MPRHFRARSRLVWKPHIPPPPAIPVSPALLSLSGSHSHLELLISPHGFVVTLFPSTSHTPIYAHVSRPICLHYLLCYPRALWLFIVYIHRSPPPIPPFTFITVDSCSHRISRPPSPIAVPLLFTCTCSSPPLGPPSVSLCQNALCITLVVYCTTIPCCCCGRESNTTIC